MHPALVAYAGRVAAPKEAGIVAVVGLPGVRGLDVRFWRSPTAGGFEVLGIVRSLGHEGARLRHPVLVVMPNAAEAEPLVAPTYGRAIRTPHADWFAYDGALARQLEVDRLDADGREIWREVPTGHTFVMSCRCGRLRYAPRKAIASITACRVCTDAGRRGRRALAQRETYRPSAGRAERDRLRARARQMRLAGDELVAIAEACGKSVSWASRVLREAAP